MNAGPEQQPPAGLGWFDAEDAPARVDLRACIHCGLCLTACPTYRTLKVEPDSPRGRLYLMRGLAEERIAPSHPLLEHLDQCLGCRACETVCPAGVPYGRLLEVARGQLERRTRARGARVPRRRSFSRRLGAWALTRLVPDRAAFHRAADLLRLGQNPLVEAFMRSGIARSLLPEFAHRGWAMTPPLLPRRERAIERVAAQLPPGARMEGRADAVVFHPAGVAKARAAFFTSCVMEVMFPRINQEAVRLLVLAGAEVTVPRGQGCCGALQAHAGMRRLAKDLARANVRAFEPGGYDLVVNDSAGCGAALREAGHLLHDDGEAERATRFASRVRDVAEALAQLGLPEATAPLRSARDRERPLRVGYHDPCHLAHAQGVRSEPRALLRTVPGVELVDLPNSDWCCGSAGVYNLSHPAMADAQLVAKIAAIEAIAPEVLVVSNPGCAMHMARGARERGLEVRMEHLVELLGRAYPPARAGVTAPPRS
jgi:glycolate oxidase iron-sulfur subunit